MFYRCGEYIDFENGSGEWINSPDIIYVRPQGKVNSPNLLGGDWLENIVEEYSSRYLTYGSDRLPALSGIVHEFRRIRGGHYLAGLWRDDLPRDLCWTKMFATGPCLKPVRYRAPSWSWAAIDGGIALPRKDYVIDAEIIHVSVELKGLDPMGEVRGGSLVICGVLQRGILQRGALSRHREQFRVPRDSSVLLYEFYLVHSNGEAISDISYIFIPDT